MIKSLIASAAIVSLLAVTAQAADPVQETEYAPAPVEQTVPLFTWSGGYVGLHGGGTWASGDFNTGGVTSNDDFNGGIFGGFVGYQMQNGDLVYGIEGDVNYNWNGNDYVTGGTTYEVGTDVSGSVRARLGYAMDRALIYATGGWAAARGYVNEAGPGGDSSETFNGFTVGAGVDYAFTDMLFGRAEYRYNNFGEKSFGATSVDFNQHQVLVGIGVKF